MPNNLKAEYIVKNAEETKALAAEIAANAKPGDVFALIGTLGSGKTTFSQGFIDSLSDGSQNVTSPTFNIIQVYPTIKGFDVWHCDLYRLKSAEQAINLGIEDGLLNAVTLIEWPEIATEILPYNTLVIRFETIDENTRKITIEN